MMNQTKHGLFVLALTACCVTAACSEDSKTMSIVPCNDGQCDAGFTCGKVYKADGSAEDMCLKDVQANEQCGSYAKCPDNLICSKKRICEPEGANTGVDGDACSTTKDCAIGFACNGTTCQSLATTVVVQPGKRGASCSSKDDCDQDLECISNICKKVSDLKGGCGENAVCKDGLVCDGNICKRELNVGGNCNDSTETVCKEGSTCIANNGMKTCVDNNDPNFTDSDNDTILDVYERCLDSTDTSCNDDVDGDTIPNYLDLDSDGDTIPDKIEAGNITAGEEPVMSANGVTFAFLSKDSDLNGISDTIEACPDYLDKVRDCGLEEQPSGSENTTSYQAFTRPFDSDNDGTPDFLTDDNDGDGLGDLEEIEGRKRCSDSCTPGTPDDPIDTDADTIPDYMSIDSDGDGILDFYEKNSVAIAGGTVPNRYLTDSDGDTLPDADEVEMVFAVQPDGKRHKYRVQYGNLSYTSKLKDSRGNIILRDDAGNYVLTDKDGKFLQFDINGKTYLAAIALDGYLYAVDYDGNKYTVDGLVAVFDEDGNPLKATSAGETPADPVACVESAEDEGVFVCEDTAANCNDEHICVKECSEPCDSGKTCDQNSGRCISVGESVTYYKNDKGYLVAKDDSGQLVQDRVCAPNPDISPIPESDTPADPVACVENEDGSKSCEAENAKCDEESNSCLIECDPECVDGAVCDKNAGVCINTFVPVECDPSCSEDTEICDTVIGSCVPKEICNEKAKTFPKDKPRLSMGASKPLSYLTPEGDVRECYTFTDCDKDGLNDKLEPFCFADEYPGTLSHDVYAINVQDADGDGKFDDAEYQAVNAAHGHLTVDYAEKLKDCTVSEIEAHPDQCFKTFIFDRTRPEDLICSQGLSSDDFIDFSFVVEYMKNEDKTSELEFKPTVSKLDLVFNLDVTGSMGKEVENLQSTLQSVVISGVRKSVEDSAFGISEFADFPIRYDINKNGTFESNEPNYGWPRGREINGGQYFKKDAPWTLHSRPEKNPGELARAVNSYSLTDGGDYPEAGYESLWMLAAGDTGSAKYASQSNENTQPGSISVEVAGGKVVNTDGRWGGAGFRQGTLPVVVHITDALSHNSGSNNKYSTTYVSGAHNDTDVHNAFKQKGIKLITIFRRGEANPKDGITVAPGSALPELEKSSNATGTAVRVCAFKKSATEWTCGANRCCTQIKEDGSGIKDTAPDTNGNCVLSYGITSAATMTETVVQGIQALVKYGTYDVSTQVRGEDITVPIVDPITKKNKGTWSGNTSCLISKIEATKYTAPPSEPAKSCNPEAQPTIVAAKDYNDGFTNFAAGTSSSQEEGASLTFTIHASDPDGCVPAEAENKSYTLFIDVVNPTTGLVFGTREVTITVQGYAGNTGDN